MKIRTKILLLLVPLIVLSLLILGRFAYIELREASEQRVFSEMRASLEHIRTHMERDIQTASGNIELLAKQTLVKKYLLTKDEEERYALFQPPLLRLFSSYQEAFPEYYEIRVFLPDGYEDARQTKPYVENRSEDEGDTDLFHALETSSDPPYAQIFRNPDDQRIALFMGTPLILIDRAIDPVGVRPSLRGYLGFTIRMSDVESRIREGIVGDSGYMFATDSAGNVIFQSSRRPVGDAIPDPLVDSALGVEGGEPQLLVSFRGEKAFVLGTHIYPGINAFVVLPERELRAISRELGIVVAGITLLTILVTTLSMMVAMEYQIIRPIQGLRGLSKEIGRGNWSINVSGATAGDEIGELASAFEEMAGNLQQSSERANFLAYHDSLTGLPNRTMFKEYLDRSIASAKRNQQPLALLFLDLDNFKQVNDTLGHHAGDVLLQAVAGRLTQVVRGDDYVARESAQSWPDGVLARLGGDEFIILLPSIPDSDAARAVAQRLIGIFRKPFIVIGQECFVTTSIGITVYPGDAADSDELIKNADVAMYHSKENGKNTYQYFDNAMNVAAIERLKLENRLRNALELNRLELYYQPQIHSATLEVEGVEALLRWRDPDDGLIPPSEFIPIAEASGLILPIGEWVLHQACGQARAWRKAGFPPRLVSVNISSVQFARQDVPSIVREALARSRLDPRCLEIEITESIIMSDPETSVRMLDEIKSLGVRLALDDFGTGYSSLSYLRRFPIDTLKIDRSFIQELDAKPADAEIVGAIAALAHSLRLRVVVEGIETERQLRAVEDRRCEIIQGFLFCRPLPADEIVHFLARHSQRVA